MKTRIYIEDICETMNQLLEKDYDCCEKLVKTRIPCNDAVLNHETIICSKDSTLGIVGLINGFFGIREDGFGPICYEINDDGIITKFYPTPEKKDDTPVNFV